MIKCVFKTVLDEQGEPIKLEDGAYKNYEFIRVRDAFKTYEGFMKFIGQEPKK